MTGGAGFIGAHTVRELLSRGIQVRVLDNFMTGSRANLKEFEKGIELIEGDIRDARDVRRALRGVEAVFHLAAIRSVMKSVENPFLAHDVNATGTLRLLDEAARRRVKHFILTSTSAVYGAAAARAQKEEGRLSPISPYGSAKLAAEDYARCYFLEKNLPTTIFRIFNVYGPRQNPESRYSLVIPGVLSKIYRGRRPVIDGSGAQARDFIFIGDVLEAFMKALGNKRAFGKVYNLGSGRAASINELVSLLLKITGSSLKPVHGPRRAGDPDRTCADMRHIRKDLGWKPKVALRRGLEETVAWAKRRES